MTDILVLGGGAWGAAFALAQAKQGNEVTIWSRSTEHTRERVARYCSHGERMSPPPPLELVESLGVTKSACALIAIALPSAAIRYVVCQLARDLPEAPLLSLAKGLEPRTGLTPIAVLTEALGARTSPTMAVFSGAHPAVSVASGRPTRGVLAADTVAWATDISGMISGPRFQVTPSADVYGVELAGPLKNVTSLVCGLADGLGLAQPEFARVLARTAGEVSRVLLAMGASAETIASAAGIEDLLETALGGISRNYTVGRSIALAGDSENALPGQAACEGIHTAAVLHKLLESLPISTPILSFANRLARNQTSPDTLRHAAALTI